MKNYHYIEIFTIAVIGVLFASVGIKNVFLAALLSGCVQLSSVIFLRKLVKSKIEVSVGVGINKQTLRFLFGIIQFIIFIYLIFLLINGHSIDNFITNISVQDSIVNDTDYNNPIISIRTIKIAIQVLFVLLSLLTLYFSINHFIKIKIKSK